MAMHVSAPIVVNGATIAGTSITGPVFTAQGNYLTVTMGRHMSGVFSAGSGTRVPGWETVLPPFAMQLDRVAMTFGEGSAPQGTAMQLKLWSNGARKGLIAVGVGAATTRATLTAALAFTFPASAVVRLTINAVSAGVAGGGGEPTLYMRHWSG